MSSQAVNGSPSSKRCPPSWQSLSAYRVSYLDPPWKREQFLALAVGWLLADSLDGPMLVYREEDVFRGTDLQDFLPECRRRVLSGYRAIATAKREGRTAEDARASLAAAIKQLRQLHRRLVMLARGYSFNRREWGPWGRPEPVVYLFDEDAAALVGRDWHPVAIAYQYPSAAELARCSVEIPEECIA